MIAWLATLRSLGFGAMFGAGVGLGIALAIRLYRPDITVEYQQFTVAGALLFGACHLLIDKWLVNSLLWPLTLFVCYYGRLFQLRYLIRNRRGLSNDSPTIKQLNDLIKDLTDNYFKHGKCP